MTEKRLFIHGAGLSRFGVWPKSWQQSLLSMLAQEKKSGTLDTVDALIVANQTADSWLGESLLTAKIAELICPQVKTTLWVNAGSASGAAAIEQAQFLLQRGYITSVLIIGIEVMNLPSSSFRFSNLVKNDSANKNEIALTINHVLDRSEQKWFMAMAHGAGLIAQRLLFEQPKLDWRRAWTKVALKNHLNAIANPNAHLRKKISEEDVAASRMIASPLCLYDCAPISDGAAYLILSSQLNDVYLAGVGSGIDHASLVERENLLRFQATAKAARRAFANAQIKPQQIGAAEMHDAFTPFELMGLQECGLTKFPVEEILAGRFDQNGELPVNVSGGLKARGHPLGASGIAQVVELVLMWRGQSFFNLKAKYCLTHSIGGLATQNFVIILGKE